MIPKFKETLEKMQEIHEKKNADYADTSDPFLNFRGCEDMGICTVEAGILVRMTDKMQRIANLLKRENKVSDENVEDTLIDLSNYAVILNCYLKVKNDQRLSR